MLCVGHERHDQRYVEGAARGCHPAGRRRAGQWRRGFDHCNRQLALPVCVRKVLHPVFSGSQSERFGITQRGRCGPLIKAYDAACTTARGPTAHHAKADRVNTY